AGPRRTSPVRATTVVVARGKKWARAAEVAWQAPLVVRDRSPRHLVARRGRAARLRPAEDPQPGAREAPRERREAVVAVGRAAVAQKLTEVPTEVCRSKTAVQG